MFEPSGATLGFWVFLSNTVYSPGGPYCYWAKEYSITDLGTKKNIDLHSWAEYHWGGSQARSLSITEEVQDINKLFSPFLPFVVDLDNIWGLHTWL